MKKTIMKEQFLKIDSESSILRLTRRFLSEKPDLTFKGPRGRVYRFLAQSIDEGHVAGRLFAPIAPIKSENVLAYVNLKKERYFFQTQLLKLGTQYHFKIPTSIYSLQGNVLERAKLPKGVQRQVNIVEVNQRTIFWEGECLDLSAGGALISADIEKVDVTRGSQLVLAFHLNKKWHFETNCKVIHLKALNRQQIAFGVEFYKVSKTTKDKINQLIVEVLDSGFESPIS